MKSSMNCSGDMMCPATAATVPVLAVPCALATPSGRDKGSLRDSRKAGFFSLFCHKLPRKKATHALVSCLKNLGVLRSL